MITEIEGLTIKKLNIIPDERGSIMHMIKKSDKSFTSFGEVYFATAYPGVIKGWHLHKKQTQNYCVIKGMVKIVVYDDRKYSKTYGNLRELFIGEKNFSLVTIPPLVHNGWKCIGEEEAILANFTDYEHDPEEMTRLDPFSKDIPYNWELKNR